MPTRPLRLENGRTPVADKLMRETIDQQARLLKDKSPSFRIQIAAILRDAAEAVLREEVVAAHEIHNLTWKEIGEALLVSPQAAHHKYAERDPKPDRP